MRRTLARELPAQRAGLDRSRSRAGCTAGGRWPAVTFVVVRDRSGLAQVVVKDPATLAAGRRATARRPWSRSPARSRPTRRRPAASRSSTRSFEALTDAGRDPAGRALAADADRRAADPARPRRGQPAAPGAPGPLAARGGQPARLPRRRSTAATSPRCTAPSWSPRPPRAARTCSRSTTSAGRPTSRSRRSSTSRCWSGCSSGSTRSGRCSGPSRTTRCGTSRSTSRSTSSSASSRDHRDVVAVLRDVVAGHGRGGPRARRRGRVGCSASTCPSCPRSCRSLHFREALEIAGAPADEPDLAPAHERAVGAWAQREHGSDLVVVEGYPTANRAFYSHPRPGGPALVALVRPALPRGRAGQRGAAAAPVRRLRRDARGRAGYDPEPYASYVDAFRYGMPPHGGFAIGLERWVSRLTGAANVREVTLFPRDLHRLTP